MIETLTIITLSIIALILFRPGKTEPLNNPLVINRIGQFHAVLAPMLNLAQPLLENISRELPTEKRQGGNTSILYFKVQDKEVKYHGKHYYLLAATLRDGVLYFQAAAPDDQLSDIDAIRNFSETELSRHPATEPHSDAAERTLIDITLAVASQRGISLNQI